MNLKKCFALVALISLLSGCSATLGRWPGGVVPAEFHAKALTHGDWRYELSGLRGDPGRIPYHWKRLVDLGDNALPVLLDMLADDTPTPFIWNSGVVSFTGNYVVSRTIRDPPFRERRATISELADYALKLICECYGVGFSSELPAKERARAIERWHKIVSERNNDS